MATKKRNTVQHELLENYLEDDSRLEMGIDEAGRGPMLGRVYSAAVVLPKRGEFHYEWMKDSKRFHSKKKLRKMAQYIKDNATYWSIGYETEQTIDKINIRNATHRAMHRAIKDIATGNPQESYYLLIDGNDFKPYIYYGKNGMEDIPHTCIKGGDNKYCAIAAASILAKVARDDYVDELCKEDQTLVERYDLFNNKGYGTKKHMDGIKNYGISEYHRKTFGICKDFA